ncbi:cupin-like domain-containing protein [Alteraurantiacibacter aestuarii]|uniref:Cupin-like domain-containing protein n=1 Tax=Alteraurantiacibacter aestuarii TaxID=650004 RepID=A0A844ZM88_9SPHN|nr:cupin-like domain-containing protein [Alteraurantiacibacter aestuarii]MXO88216.1 cupin-like domain-containing protein [Alteraurantiacibacter aestuarii]
MSGLADPPPLDEITGPIDQQRFDQIRAANRPVVLRGLVEHWPAVAAGRQGGAAIVAYLHQCGSARPVTAIAAMPAENGRFFYNSDLSGMNFVKGQGQLGMFLDDLLRAADLPQPPGLAVQSEGVAELLPAFAQANRLDLLAHVPARIWIGNRIRVAAHYDVKENIACCVSGHRRFTLYPPEQIANLYPGPFESTPAGTPVSMVDAHSPDLARYPRFADAWASARQATLAPGDAIYIPYCWWHGVESLDPVSILVNYWWNDGQPAGIGGPYDALLHALLAYRHLPPGQREVWRGMLDYYVFEKSGDPAAHLPDHAAGVIGKPSPGLFDKMRQIIRQALG